MRDDGLLTVPEGWPDNHLNLRKWAHMLGFRGHFSTKTRAYSTTLGALRAARAAWHRGHAPPASPPTLVLAHWA
ncbi:replication initiator [Streptomyces sp. NPDC016562]|uniref:replication initiator n=1 Tax=Streptomyces sp. NPDC016562 TaxID=3364966 RepID=UPI0037008E67